MVNYFIRLRRNGINSLWPFIWKKHMTVFVKQYKIKAIDKPFLSCILKNIRIVEEKQKVRENIYAGNFGAAAFHSSQAFL